jgi:hypothetical protein
MVADFSANNNDPNANILPTYNFLTELGILSLLVFYNKPTPPPGLFDAFLGVPSLTRDVKTRSFLDFVKNAPSNATQGLR